MINPTLSTMLSRRSLRNYSDQPLTAEEKDAILTATFRAPTAGNLMLYSIIEVEDQALKDRLAETCDHQPFIAKAPYVLLFLADYQRWFDAFKDSGVEARCAEVGKAFRSPQVGDLMLACCDALIAAQNAVIAAQSLGIGSCYIGDILENYEIHRQMFDLPRYVLPVTLLCFGRPAGEMPAGLVRRFDREFILHKNTYHRFSAEEIGRMMAPLAEKFAATPEGLARNVVQSVYFRKFIADFSVEMSRSVGEMLKNWGS